MGKIDRYFFALPRELVDIIEEWKKEFDFHLVVMQLFPDIKVFEIGGFEELKELPIKLEEIFCTFFGQKPPNLNVKNRYDFLEKNQDFLTVNVGRLDSRSLGESWLTGLTEDPNLQKLWEKVGRELRKKTKGGLWAINTELGGKHFYRDVRYTLGAEEFFRKGGKLLSEGSFVHFSIDEPQ